MYNKIEYILFKMNTIKKRYARNDPIYGVTSFQFAFLYLVGFELRLSCI